MSCMFIHCLDKDRYGQLKKDQHNSYLVGKLIYTDTIVDAKKLLKEWKGSRKKSAPPQQQPANEPGVEFVEAGTASKEKKAGKDVICHGCSKKGHYLSECYKTPDADKERILKIKTQEWNDKKKKGVAAVEVEADGVDKPDFKDGLPEHNLALYLLGYDLINVGSVEGEDTSEVIPVFEDFDGDTVNGLGFVEAADATVNEPGKI